MPRDSPSQPRRARRHGELAGGDAISRGYRHPQRSAEALRAELEQSLGLDADDLDARHHEVEAAVAKVRCRCARCGTDLAEMGIAHREQLRDKYDARLYCIPCWQARAYGHA